MAAKEQYYEHLISYLSSINTCPAIGDEKMQGRFTNGLILRSRKTHGRQYSLRYIKFFNDEPIAVLQIVGSYGKATATTVFVKREHRRKGIATELFKEARKHYKIEFSTDRSLSGEGWAKAMEQQDGKV